MDLHEKYELTRVINACGKMTALSGSAEQVKAAASAYRVYYAKGEGDGEFYLMDHSTFK